MQGVDRGAAQLGITGLAAAAICERTLQCAQRLVATVWQCLRALCCVAVPFVQQADRRTVGLLRSQNRPVSLQFDASTPADVAAKIGLMQAMEPSSFSETLQALTGERSFALNRTQYGPPLSDTSATAMAYSMPQ